MLITLCDCGLVLSADAAAALERYDHFTTCGPAWAACGYRILDM
jgi:hypothetical protein